MTEPADPPRPGSDYTAPPAYPPPDARYAEPIAPPAEPGWRFGPPLPESPTRPLAPSRRRKPIAIAVAVAAAALLGGYFLFFGDTGAKRPALPSSFAGYTRSHDATSDRVEKQVRASVSGADGDTKRAFSRAGIGVYTRDSDVGGRLIVLALDAASISAADRSSAREQISRLLDQIGGGTTSYPAGPHGGTSQCALITIGQVRERMCVWADAHTVGLIESVTSGGAPLSGSQLNRVELALRDKLD